LLLGGVLFASLLLGPYWLWWLLVVLSATTGLWEFQGLMFPAPLPHRLQILYLGMGAVLPAAAALGGVAGLHLALLIAIFSGFSFFLLFSPDHPRLISCLARFALAWLYIPYLLTFVLLLGTLEKRRLWLFLVFVIILAGDIGAFYGGRQWGRHKLYERVSPKKTWEGAVAGLVASILGAAVYALLCLDELSVPQAALFGLTVGTMGQIGDLMESMIKRASGKKDSSNLLPGHGGLLDRLDSLLLAFPTTWFLHKWLVH
jgi:phosphatidate cytidylyltransferase